MPTKSNKTKKEQLQEAYIHVYSGPEGQMVLEHMLKEAGLTKWNRNVSYENCLLQKGLQQYFFSIMTIIGTDPRDMIAIAQEQNKMTTNYEKQRSVLE